MYPQIEYILVLTPVDGYDKFMTVWSALVDGQNEKLSNVVDDKFLRILTTIIMPPPQYRL